MFLPLADCSQWGSHEIRLDYGKHTGTEVPQQLLAELGKPWPAAEGALVLLNTRHLSLTATSLSMIPPAGESIIRISLIES